MDRFYKTGECPASEILAALQGPFIAGDELQSHLASCEFCSAELEFYRRYPPREEMVEPSRIPGPLYDLADALLHKTRNLKVLNKLVGRRD
jgi:hypothetical protein